ncbi:MAG: AAA family ATPase [Blastocatellia bacterium]
MRIDSVEIRRFRSVGSATMKRCGSLNILIGKNNAGKSNLLAAIELVIHHFNGGALAAKWSNQRPRGDFTDRDDSQNIEIGLQFELTPSLNEDLRAKMIDEAPHLDKSIEQIKEVHSVSFVLNGARQDEHYFLFIKNVYAGKLKSDTNAIGIDGLNLLTLSQPVAYELYTLQMQLEQLHESVTNFDRLTEARLEFMFPAEGRPRPPLSAYLPSIMGAPFRPEILHQVDALGASANNINDFRSGIARLREQAQTSIRDLIGQKTQGSMTAFAGEVQTTPNYILWLLRQYGAIPLLHLRETRAQIGREEAATLLSLKVRRGGPERLAIIQQTVRDLMGVSVDAFEAEGGRKDASAAEIDVDNFLVEANGSGIREALRLILDLELKSPKLALIEEPESHLHPGLARVMANYLRRKSQDIQLFVTTHSTEFIDTASFENAYLVSRGADKKTICDSLSAADAALRIPAELGLRLSTVFMYDRLIFVEGATDETILSILAEKLTLDLPRSNVGFVHMKGVRNFAHFAAEGTLDLLSRRRVRLWFVADRDERDDLEVQRMVERLEGHAALVVLKKRELENYLVDPKALEAFIAERIRRGVAAPDENKIQEAIDEVAQSLKPEVIRLKLEDRLLKPIFLHTRESKGKSINERLSEAIAESNERLSRLGAELKQINESVDGSRGSELLQIVPGTELLEEVCKKFEVSYSKAGGDGDRLARLLSPDRIEPEIRDVLKEICAAE